MMELILLLVFITALVFLLTLRHFQDKHLFESKGIPYLGNGTFNQILATLKETDPITSSQIQYNQLKSKHCKIAGVKDFGKHSFLILDPDLIKSILVKDFHHFSNRRAFPLPEHEVIFKKMLFSYSQEDGRWKSLRNQLSPVFTKGNLRRFFHIFHQSGKNLIKYLDSQLDSSRTSEIDVGDAFSKFAMDIIASAVCGMESKAFDQVQPSLFEEMGKKLQIKSGLINAIKVTMIMLLPKLSNIFKLSFFDSDAQDFFTKAIKASIKTAETNNNGITRNDMIQIILERRNQTKTKSNLTDPDLLDHDGIIANCVLFILAGFDTTRSTLLFSAYVLALNQDVQDKLRKYVDQVWPKDGEDITLDSLTEITYLDMVINETLRMYPSIFIDRDCTMDYKVSGSDLVIKKGQGIVIPVYGLHHDKDFYPNPEKFDPERFSPANKDKMDQYTFLGFGRGPRNCVGMRFALAEVKVAISYLVHHFHIEPSQGTHIPMKFEKCIQLQPEGGQMVLSLKKIKQ